MSRQSVICVSYMLVWLSTEYSHRLLNFFPSLLQPWFSSVFQILCWIHSLYPIYIYIPMYLYCIIYYVYLYLNYIYICIIISVSCLYCFRLNDVYSCPLLSSFSFLFSGYTLRPCLGLFFSVLSWDSSGLFFLGNITVGLMILVFALRLGHLELELLIICLMLVVQLYWVGVILFHFGRFQIM